jgi:hypothetical protein
MKLCLSISLSILFIACGYSQSIYHKDTFTILADSLQKEGDYKQAVSVRKQAIKTQKRLQPIIRLI